MESFPSVKWRSLLTALTWYTLTLQLQAACEAPTTALNSASYTDAVFVGRAVSIAKILPEAYEIGQSLRPKQYLTIHFDVIERFPYWRLSSMKVDVKTNASQNALGFPFAVGKRYLVFARRNEDGELFVDRCSATQNFAEASVDLRYLRGLSRQRQLGELRGQIVDGAAPDVGVTWAPSWVYSLAQLLLPPSLERTLLRGMSVRLTGDGESQTAITDGEGSFSFWQLRPGFYSLHLDDKDQRLNIFKPIHVLPGRSSPLQLHSYPPKTIRGTIQTAEGLPAKRLTVDVASGDNLDFPGVLDLSSTIADQAGYFEFSNYLGPKKLVLGVGLASQPSKRTPYKTWFYPGTADLRSAQIFDFSDGARTFDIQFKLPRALPLKIVKVMVLNPEGNVDVKAEVTVLQTDAGVRTTLQCCTNSGSIAFWAIEEHYYEVIASGHDSKGVPCRSPSFTFWNKTAAPREVQVSLTNCGVF